jgi:hypothetical protein
MLVDLTALFLNYEPEGQDAPSTSEVAEFVAPRPIRRVDRLGQQKSLDPPKFRMETASIPT